MTRQEAVERLKSIKSLVNKYDDVVALREAIKALEQEPKTGHWVEHEIEDTVRWLECSNCHYETYNVKHNYCSNCGYRMVEPQESEDKE